MTAARPELAMLTTSEKRRRAGVAARAVYRREQERAKVVDYLPKSRLGCIDRVKLIFRNGIWLTVFVERRADGRLVEGAGVLATVGEVALWKQLQEAKK